MDEQKSQNEQKVVVTCQITDIRMPFWSMVVFLVKLFFAAFPAMILLCISAVLALWGLVLLFGPVSGFHAVYHQFRFPF